MASSSFSMPVIDHLGEIQRFIDLSSELPIEDGIGLFNELVFVPNARFYTCVPGMSPEAIKAALPDIETKFDHVFAVRNEILDRFHTIVDRFQQSFPQFQQGVEVHLLFSLGLFNGMALPLEGKLHLLLGMDALAGLSTNHLKGYLTHELFHAYHFQRCPAVARGAEEAMRLMKMPPLWAMIWTEGIACQAIRQIYPDIPEDELLDWHPLVHQCKPILATLAAEARKSLNSDAMSDIAGFFYFPRPDRPEIPTGCGYYLGLKIAEIMTLKHPVDQLIELPDEELIREIDASLQVIKE
jgi:hypothetical protein